MRSRAATIAVLLSALTAAASTASRAGEARANDPDRFALRFEGGVGGMLSDFQRNDRGYGVAWQGSARLAFVLGDPVAMQFGVSNWVFPSNTGGTGWAFVPSGGIRVEPSIGTAGRFWIDAHAGVGLTGDEARFVFDVGMGFEFAPVPWFVFGPAVRYGQMIQPDTRDGAAEPFPDDARFVSAGLTVAFRLPPRTRTATQDPPPQQPPTPSPPPAPRDGDNDGEPDATDLCITLPRGDHPDPTRAGCPTPDTDFDTVLDPDDRCVTVPQGPHPDPVRRGCPAADDDGDGVLNDTDRCPMQPATSAADASRPGCPDGDRDGDGVRDGVDQCIDDRETYNGVVDGDGCPETGVPTSVDLDPQNHVVTLRGTVNFITGSATLVGRASFDLLDGLANLLIQHPEIALVEIQGHTDQRGDRATNVALSQRRAQTVLDYLAARGVAAARLRAMGYGPDRPVDTRSLPEAWNANRRTEVHVLRWNQAAQKP
jgi:outer membrane protein OmpA-like peptidoglycan-associated protein